MKQEQLLGLLRRALASRDRDERADLLAEAMALQPAGLAEELAAIEGSENRIAICLLARSFKRSLPLTVTAAFMSDEDAQVRSAAVASIGYRPADETMLAMVGAALADDDEWVRVAAVRAVRDNGSERLTELLDAMQNDPSEHVRRWLADRSQS